MPDPKHKLDREEIMSFLLGELEEAETSRIEAMFLSDPTYSEAIEEAKSELFEKYQSGRLSPQQSGRFVARFLPDLEEDKRKFQAMLDQNEAQRHAGLEAAEAPESPATAKGASGAVTRTPAPTAPRQESPGKGKLPLLIGALVLILGGLIAALVLTQGGEKATAEAEPVALSVFSVRGKSQVIALPKRERVVLHLPVAADEAAESFTIVAYHGESEATWAAKRAGTVVETTVEPDSLDVGRYDLELRRADGTVVGYYSLQK